MLKGIGSSIESKPTKEVNTATHHVDSRARPFLANGK